MSSAITMNSFASQQYSTGKLQLFFSVPGGRVGGAGHGKQRQLLPVKRLPAWSHSYS